jgi:hypothetical protein
MANSFLFIFTRADGRRRGAADQPGAKFRLMISPVSGTSWWILPITSFEKGCHAERSEASAFAYPNHSLRSERHFPTLIQ